MSKYEITVLARQELSAAQITTLQEELAVIVTKQGGTINKQENWGLRVLAYLIKKAKRAHYLYLEADMPAAGQHELSRLMGLHENILRSLIVHVEKFQEGPTAVMLAKQRDESKAAEYEAFDGGFDVGGDQGYRPRARAAAGDIE